ncbi:hypothetical protein Tco_1142491 [Tanacetum coccineum]
MRSLIYFFCCKKYARNDLRSSMKLSMLSGWSSSNHSLATPIRVELNMYNHIDMAHRSTFAAVWKFFGWSFEFSVPSYILTLLGMHILLGNTKLRIRGVNESVSSQNQGDVASDEALGLPHSSVRIYRGPPGTGIPPGASILMAREPCEYISLRRVPTKRGTPGSLCFNLEKLGDWEG